MSMAPLLGLPGKVKTLIDRLTSTRATNLDNLDAAITTRAAAATALSSATWTGTRAGYIDLLNTHLDANTGIMLPKFQLLTSGTTWTRPANIIDNLVLVSAIAGGEAVTTGSRGGTGGSFIQRYPYTAGATVSYSIGAGGTGTAGADGSDTVWGTITLKGGGATGHTGSQGGESYTGIDITPLAPPGPYGSYARDSFGSGTGGGGGLMLNGTVYGAGGSTTNNAGTAGAILVEWWEYA
jgi:hypothetical protein